MTAQAHKLTAESWRPLPCGGRVLVAQEYELHWDHVPEGKSKKATRKSTDSNFSAADASARDRERLAMAQPLHRAERSDKGRGKYA